MKKLRITVEGKTYEVQVEVLGEDPSSQPDQAPVGSASVGSASVSAPVSAPRPSAAAAGAGGVPSPLAGKVVSVQVAEGQAVKEGDQLLTLEAMKMNTYIYAPCAGRIAKILVAAGDAVEEGQNLVQIG